MKKPLRPFLMVVASVSGRDRWLIGWHNTIRWAADAPRWMSWRSKRNRDHAKRGGC